jgi:hypothetical protein
MIELFDSMISGAREYHKTAQCHLCPALPSSFDVPQSPQREEVVVNQNSYQKSIETKVIKQSDLFSDIVNLNKQRSNLIPNKEIERVGSGSMLLADRFREGDGMYEDARWRHEMGNDDDDE